MAKLFINVSEKESHINPEIYGHFSEHLGRCIYEGLYVGEDSHIPNTNGIRNDVVEALKEMKLPVLRWPGGCFADEYHWKDGIGDKSKRKKMINTHWGGVVEDNSFGTHEFMELCQQIGCKAYINGNVGSGTVQEMSEWIEYMTFDGLSPMSELRKQNGRDEPWTVSYFGVGNENWGCGGNMSPEYYADLYRRYATYVRTYHDDKKIFKVACGPNVDDYEWTRVLMKKAASSMDGLSLHYYTIPGEWNHKGSATQFDESDWYTTMKKALKINELVHIHSAIMDEYDPQKRIGLIVDEWGTWFDVEPGTNPGFLYQQNTMRDALVAAIHLNIFNKHSDRIKMANIAQLVNVLQSPILTEGENMLLTPTYYVFHMFKYHQDATLVHSFVETDLTGTNDENQVPNITESASVAADGTVNVTISNLSLTDAVSIEVTIIDIKVSNVKATILTNTMNAYNDFSHPDNVHTEDFTDFTMTDKGIDFTLPPLSIIHFMVK